MRRLLLAAVLGFGLAAGMLLTIDVALGDTTWVTQTVDTEGDVGKESSLALDVSGTPHVAYYDSSNNSVKYAVLSGTTWVSETVDKSAPRPSLALDGSGVPHIAYTRPWPKVAYATLSGTVWVTETVDDQMVAGPSLALDDSGNPHIAYWDVRPSPPHGPGEGLKYAYWTASHWVTGTIDPVQSQFAWLALDNLGIPHVAYQTTPTVEIRYAVLSGTNWLTQTVEVGGEVSLALGSSGVPHIAYTYTGPEVRYAVLSGTNWLTETVQGGAAYPSLALDASDNPHMAYPFYVSGKVTYAYWTGSGWIKGPIDPINGQYPSLALSYDGLPRISYYDVANGNLKYAAQYYPISLPLVLKNP